VEEHGTERETGMYDDLLAQTQRIADEWETAMADLLKRIEGTLNNG